MPKVAVGDLELYYDAYGDPSDQTVLLIPGLGAQCLSWPEELCESLAARYLHVVRFDNRDVGLSTKLNHLPFSLDDMVAKMGSGEVIEAPYGFSEMAADAVGLMDALGIESAHVVGLSLGGMIAQVLAIESPNRLLSLTSVMSASGNVGYGQPTEDSLAMLLGNPVSSDRSDVIEFQLRQRATWGSPDHLDEAEAEAYFNACLDRSDDSVSGSRHYGAIFTAYDREPGLRDLTMPTLLLHGTADKLVQPSGSERLAELIPHAELVWLEGMGHDLPTAYWATIIENITQHVVRASA
ncbi:MAG: alpha/beta fold hydrolase [Acidimicrobiales bacterium]